jgi:hypothetical protein
VPKKRSNKVSAHHILYGVGEVLSVRALDSGGLVADMKFPGGSDRTIRLLPQYWLTPIAGLMPTAPAKPKRVRKAPVNAEKELANAA